jgi:MFS family permease
VVPLLLALSWGGNDYPWSSPTIIGSFGFAALMLAVFIFVESRAAEPIIPLSLFSNPIITTSIIALVLMAIGMFGTILFIPLFIQAVIGTSATQSGTVMMPMTIVMIGSSILGGQLISRTGRYKVFGLYGMSVMAIGLFLLSGMGPDTDYLTVVRNMLIVGIGLGPTMPVFTLSVQNAVSMSQLGVATSLTQFARSIGSTLGVAVFGALLSNRFAPAFQAAVSPEVRTGIPPQQLAQFQNPQVLINPQAAESMRQQAAALGPQGAALFESLFAAVKVGLVAALHDVFLLAAALAAIGAITVIFMKELPLRKSYAQAPGAAAGASETAAQVGKDAFPSLPPLRPEDQPPAREPTPLPKRRAG